MIDASCYCFAHTVIYHPKKRGKNQEEMGKLKEDRDGDNFKGWSLISYGIRMYRHRLEKYCRTNRVSVSSGGIRTYSIDLRLYWDKMMNGVQITCDQSFAKPQTICSEKNTSRASNWSLSTNLLSMICITIYNITDKYFISKKIINFV